MIKMLEEEIVFQDLQKTPTCQGSIAKKEVCPECPPLNEIIPTQSCSWNCVAYPGGFYPNWSGGNIACVVRCKTANIICVIRQVNGVLTRIDGTDYSRCQGRCMPPPVCVGAGPVNPKPPCDNYQALPLNDPNAF